MRERLYKKTGYGKNATVLLLTVAFLFCRAKGLFLTVSAEEADTPRAKATALLLDGLLDCADVLELGTAELPAERLGEVYGDLLRSYPELFHVAMRLSYTTYWREGVRLVGEVYPTYNLTGDALTTARQAYREEVSDLLAELDTAFRDRFPTEAETVLWIHDTLADRYAYDTRPEGEANAAAYRFFTEGRGICQAYALAFAALCRGAGLEAHLVVSESMDHAWNHVRVDGIWYHVDVTRDDPIPAEGGAPAVHHRRFLRSDGGMNVLGYFGYSCSGGHACTDTRFETAEGGILEGFSTPLTYTRAGWVGMDGEGSIVGIKFTKKGVFVGQVGDVNVDGSTDPADLLGMYDPTLPEAWRNWMRERLIKRTSDYPAEAR